MAILKTLHEFWKEIRGKRPPIVPYQPIGEIKPVFDIERMGSRVTNAATRKASSARLSAKAIDEFLTLVRGHSDV